MQNKTSSTKISLILSVVALIIAGASYMCPKKTCLSCSGEKGDSAIKDQVIQSIKENPQAVVSAMEQGMAEKRDAALKQIPLEVFANKDVISKMSMNFGSKGAKVSFIAFLDPLCKHCIDFQKEMVKIVKSKKNVTFSLMPVAILGEDSITLARIYYAIYSKNPEKALEFIDGVTKFDGQIDKDAIEKILKKVSLNSKDIEAMFAESDKKLAANGTMADKIHIPVVPAVFAIADGKATMMQSVSMDAMLQIVDGGKASQDPAPASVSDEKQSEKK